MFAPIFGKQTKSNSTKRYILYLNLFLVNRQVLASHASFVGMVHDRTEEGDKSIKIDRWRSTAAE